MRLSLRFILPLLVVLGAIAYAVVPLVDTFTLRWFVRDLDSRATLIATTVQEPLQDAVRAGDRARALALFRRITPPPPSPPPRAAPSSIASPSRRAGWSRRRTARC